MPEELEKTKEKTGPKPRSPENLKNSIATIVLTQAERDRLYEFADDMGMSVSNVLRRGLAMYMKREGKEFSPEEEQQEQILLSHKIRTLSPAPEVSIVDDRVRLGSVWRTRRNKDLYTVLKIDDDSGRVYLSWTGGRYIRNIAIPTLFNRYDYIGAQLSTEEEKT